MTMLDATQVVKEQERTDRLPFIAPEEFYYKYEPQPDGSIKQDEWVRWIKKGQKTPAAVPEKISRLQKDPNNPIWQVLKPFYERWKQGQTAPINGTPLAAWPGATPQLVKVMETVSIYSIEDLARMEDSAIQRIALPGLRNMQKNARAFLEAQSTTAKVSGELAVLRDRMEGLQRENDTLKALIDSRKPAELTEQAAAPYDVPAPQPEQRGSSPDVGELGLYRVSQDKLTIRKNKGGRPKGSKNKVKPQAETILPSNALSDGTDTA